MKSIKSARKKLKKTPEDGEPSHWRGKEDERERERDRRGRERESLQSNS
jgi:hypothetical protein